MLPVSLSPSPQEGEGMTEQRPEPRMPVDLPVRVFGMDVNERPFFQHAKASNISKDGALLSGVEHSLKVGDVIGVQHSNKKARFKVVWVIDAGLVQHNQVGVQLLPDQECPWNELLSVEKTPAPAAPPLPQNRRRFFRHSIAYPMEVKDERVNTPLRVSATDISGSGCYIQTILPLPKGTRLKAEFWIESEKIVTPAVVRACDPGVGMGIEFIGLTEQARHQLQRHLDKIDPPGSGLEIGKPR
jgi:PilZ domain